MLRIHIACHHCAQHNSHRSCPTLCSRHVDKGSSLHECRSRHTPPEPPLSIPRVDIASPRSVSCRNRSRVSLQLGIRQPGIASPRSVSCRNRSHSLPRSSSPPADIASPRNVSCRNERPQPRLCIRQLGTASRLRASNNRPSGFSPPCRSLPPCTPSSAALLSQMGSLASSARLLTHLAALTCCLNARTFQQTRLLSRAQLPAACPRVMTPRPHASSPCSSLQVSAALARTRPGASCPLATVARLPTWAR